MFKAVLLVCALALMIQSITGRCIGAAYDGFGPFGAYDGFGAYGAFDGIGPYGYGAFDGIGPYGYGAFDGIGAYGYGAYGYGLAGPYRAGIGYGAFI